MSTHLLRIAALLGLLAPLAHADPAYPLYRPADDLLTAPGESIQASGTCNFVVPAVRALEKRTKLKFPPTELPDSATVAESLLAGKLHLGFTSIALSPEDKEKFQRSNGFSIIEIPVAQDAIEILVNAANPLNQITLAQLAAIYEDEAPPDERKSIRDWAQLGGEPGPIVVYGGGAGWGTTRTFKKEVLGGRAFRKDMIVGGMGGHGGVEDKVAGNAAAIGFTSLQTARPDSVRALPIEVRKGSPALGTDRATLEEGSYPLERYFYAYLARPSIGAAEPGEREVINFLLSDEGQAVVAKSESFPLPAREVVKARAALGLK